MMYYIFRHQNCENNGPRQLKVILTPKYDDVHSHKAMSHFKIDEMFLFVVNSPHKGLSLGSPKWQGDNPFTIFQSHTKSPLANYALPLPC